MGFFGRFKGCPAWQDGALRRAKFISIIVFMFAVVRISGKQYTVSPGKSVVVDKIDGKVGDTIKFDRVLLVSDTSSQVGSPTVKGAWVSAKIVRQEKGTKIEVRRFKSKVRHRRHIGFRPLETTLEILSVKSS